MNRTKIKKHLDEIFSHYIRIVHADEGGKARCFTCDKIAPYHKLYCGHFASRKHLPTRWDARNCRPQCYACNMLRGGEQWNFGKRLNQRSAGIAERVFAEAASGRKWSTAELCNMVSHYRAALIREIKRRQRGHSGVTEATIKIANRHRRLEIFNPNKDFEQEVISSNKKPDI
jgi:hypothetical protein